MTGVSSHEFKHLWGQSLVTRFWLGKTFKEGKLGFVKHMQLFLCAREDFGEARQPTRGTLDSMMQGPCAPAGTWYWELCRNTWLAWSQVQCIAELGQAWGSWQTPNQIVNLYLLSKIYWKGCVHPVHLPYCCTHLHVYVGLWVWDHIWFKITQMQGINAYLLKGKRV